MNIAIILAAGKSRRFGKTDKLFAQLDGRPVISHAISAFERHFLIDQVIVVGNQQNLQKIIRLVKTENFSKVSQILIGQKTRQGSLFNAIDSLSGSDPDTLAIVHNGANPFVTEKEITDVLKAAKKTGAAYVGRRTLSTPHLVSRLSLDITKENLALAETPQAIRLDILQKGMVYAKKYKIIVTDDVSLAKLVGVQPVLVQASAKNRKITFPEDLQQIRMGAAADSHEFSRTHRGLKLAGISFPNKPRLEADSDGDVILHAIAAAISQAKGEGSLGTFATALCKKGIKDSRKYLKKAYLRQIGIHLETSAFKIDPLVPRLKKSLAKILKISEMNIGITASNEPKNGIRCIASLLCYE